jgi:phosphoglycolate phosphatase-like HAD superfamily hydrolase
MAPMMAEMIEGGGGPDEAVRKMVREYVDESTGVQTIFQMKWLAEQARAYGRGGAETDGWDAWMYKAEYNRRLMAPVGERCARIASGGASPAGFMISGSREMLELLAGRGIELYVASGTDDADVKREAALLGLAGLFTDIKGAPEGSESCPKEAAIRALINERGFGGGRLAVVGDGKVEIAVGRENGARTLGVASDEEALAGVNPAKRARLLSAKADAIVGDFRDMEAIKEFFLGEARHGEG